ncbi:ATP-binding protein [Escherichia coli]|uniref:ATP-binding protein n=1 Tax=Escherichia coli TaxID=562 RepID=UPI002B273DB6|nr:ATP-binding protein [Escherichia coli]
MSTTGIQGLLLSPESADGTCFQGRSYSKLLTRLNNSDLLLLDDWGLEPFSSEQRSDLLDIVDMMYQRGSIIVVSQLPVENRYKMIGDSTHADAILERLVHGSIKIDPKRRINAENTIYVDQKRSVKVI